MYELTIDAGVLAYDGVDESVSAVPLRVRPGTSHAEGGDRDGSLEW